MGRSADAAVAPGTRGEPCPTGGVLPRGRRRRGHGRVHRRRPCPARSRWSGRSPPARASCAPTRTPRRGAELVPAGRPLRRRRTSACWPRPASPTVRVHARPRVTIFSTGDEVVPPRDARRCARARSATRPRWRSPRSCARPVASPDRRRHRARRCRRRWTRRCAARVDAERPGRRLGGLVGRRARRDRRRGAPRSGSRASGATASRSGPASPRCWPSATACRSSGCRATPRSALVVFRLIGLPLVRLVGGVHDAAARADARARPRRATCPRRPAASTSSRCALADGVATPVFGLSALLSVLTAADGYVIVPEECDRPRRGHRGRRHRYVQRLTRVGHAGQPVHPRRPRRRRARGAWRAQRVGRGLPGQRVPAATGLGSPTPPGWSRAGPVWAAPLVTAVRRGRRWTGSPCAPQTPSARARPRRSTSQPDAYVVVDTGDPMPAGCDAVVMREHVHYRRRAPRSSAPPCRPTSTCARSART